MLILRMAETIAQASGESVSLTPEEVFAALPDAIRETLVQGDEAAFEKALEALSSEEQQAVLAALQYLREQIGGESKKAE